MKSLGRLLMATNIELWEKIFQERGWGKYPPLALVRFIARHFKDKDPKKEYKVLELGSGGGANLWFLAREGFKVSCIEGSATAVKISREMLIKEGFKNSIGELLVGDYREIGLLKNQFDAVIDVESLSCNSFEDSQKVMAGILNVLKPGGYFFSMTFADGSWGFESSQEVGYHAVIAEDGPLKGKGYVRYTSREDIDNLYAHPGVELKNIERYDRVMAEGTVKEWAIEGKKL